MDIKKTGDFIAKCRKEKGMTQKQLAESIGVSDKSVSKWERGVNLLESASIIPLCECLEIEVQELLLGEHIEKSRLNEEANKLLVDLASQDKMAFCWYQLLLLFVLLPAIFIVIWIILDNIINIIDPNLFCLVIMLYAPFTMMLGVFKGFECIKYGENYFKYLLLTSMSILLVIFMFMYLI